MKSLHGKLIELVVSSQDFVMGITKASRQVSIKHFFVTELIILSGDEKRGGGGGSLLNTVSFLCSKHILLSP